MSTKQAVLSLFLIVVLVGAGIVAQSLIRGKQHEALAQEVELALAMADENPAEAEARLAVLADRAAYLAGRSPILEVDLLRSFAAYSDFDEFTDHAGGMMPNSPPTVRFIVAPIEAKVNELIRFTLWITDPDPLPKVRHTTDWGDGTSNNSILMPAGYGGELYHQWGSPGTYTVTVQAWDEAGLASQQISYQITITGPVGTVTPDPVPVEPGDSGSSGGPVESAPKVPVVSRGGEDSGVCAQVVTYARFSSTNYTSSCVAFPTPCDVPAGWTTCTPPTVSLPTPRVPDPVQPIDPWYPYPIYKVPVAPEPKPQPKVNNRPEFVNLDTGWVARAGKNRSYTVRAQDIDGDELTFTIDWGDGNITTTEGKAESSWFGRFFDSKFAVQRATVRHTYARPGMYYGKVIVEDPYSTGVGSGGYRVDFIRITVK